MSAIKTLDDWWKTAKEHWPDLMNIMDRFLPMTGFETWDRTLIGVPLREHVVVMLKQRDRDLPRILNAAWAAAPDQQSIHIIPGWNVLCDLCSEEWVFEEPEP